MIDKFSKPSFFYRYCAYVEVLDKAKEKQFCQWGFEPRTSADRLFDLGRCNCGKSWFIKNNKRPFWRKLIWGWLRADLQRSRFEDERYFGEQLTEVGYIPIFIFCPHRYWSHCLEMLNWTWDKHQHCQLLLGGGRPVHSHSRSIDIPTQTSCTRSAKQSPI